MSEIKLTRYFQPRYGVNFYLCSDVDPLLARLRAVELLARAQQVAYVNWYTNDDGVLVVAVAPYGDDDPAEYLTTRGANGLPILTDELRAALEEALT